MTLALVACTDDVVRERSHGPVVGADDTLVVVGQCHASHLYEESVLGFHSGPGFEDVERALARLSPDSAVLDVQLCFEARPFKAYHESLTVHQELRFVVICRRCHSAVAYFAVGEYLEIYLQRVLLRGRQPKRIFLLSA